MLARHLTSPGPTDPEQAWLRGSVSTAYYALFHLLTQETAQRWTGSQAARLGLERTLRHDQMKDVCLRIRAGSWKGWSTPQLSVPTELRHIADIFVGLQEARHQADYNNEKLWTDTEVDAKVNAADTAFQNWKKIQGSPVADEYLLSLMIGKKRE